MSEIRMSLIVLVLITVCVCQIAAWQGNQPAVNPAFGEWEFTGKDDSGVVWTGTLTLSKVDPERFRNADKYHAVCLLEAGSEKGGRGVEHPGSYDPSTRTLSFGEEGRGMSFYTAVLSTDGRRLEKGKWRQSDRGIGAEEFVVSTGDWSAEFISQDTAR